MDDKAKPAEVPPPAAAPPAAAPPAPAPSVPAPSAPEEGIWLRLLRHPVLHIGIVAAFVFGAWLIAGQWDSWTSGNRIQSSDDASLAGDVLPLSAQVAGYVKNVAVDDYQAVHAGQMILELDPTDAQAQLDIATAQVAVAQTALDQMAAKRAIQQDQIRAAEASSAVAKAQTELAQITLDRQGRLTRSGIAGSQADLDNAVAALQEAQAQYDLSLTQIDQQKDQLALLDPAEASLRAALAAAQGQARLAKANLGYTRITAPGDGTLGLRLVRPGQYLAAGTPVAPLVLAQGLWVNANFRETQIAHMQVGSPATVTLDAFPGLVLQGQIARIAPATGSTFALLPPDNATGNFTKVAQRLSVKVALKPVEIAGKALAPGMSATVRVDTGAAPLPELAAP